MNNKKRGIRNNLFKIAISLSVIFSFSLFITDETAEAAKYNVEVSGKIRGNGKKQKGAQILIYGKTGQLFKELYAPKGKFQCKLPIDNEYVLFVVQSPFEVKVIDFNTQIEGISLNDVWAFHNLKIDLINKKDTDTKKALNAIERVDWDLDNAFFEHSFLAMPRKYDSKYKEYLSAKKFDKATKIIFKIIDEYLNGTSDDMLVITEGGLTKEELEKKAEQNKELVSSLKLKKELIKLDLEATNLKLEFLNDPELKKQVAKNLSDIEALLAILDEEIMKAEENYSDDKKLLQKYDNIDDQLFSIKTSLDKNAPEIDSTELKNNYESKYKQSTLTPPSDANKPNNTMIQNSNEETLEFTYNEEKGDQEAEIQNEETLDLEAELNKVETKLEEQEQKQEETSSITKTSLATNIIDTEKPRVKSESNSLNQLSEEELWKKVEESKRRHQEKLIAQQQKEEEERRIAAERAKRLEAERNSTPKLGVAAEEHYANKDDSTNTFINDLLKNKTPIEEYNFNIGKDTIFVKKYKTTKGEFVVLTDKKQQVKLLKNNALVTEKLFGQKEQAYYSKLEKLKTIPIRYDKISIIKSTSKKGLVFRVQIGALARPNPKAFMNLRDLGPLSTDFHNNSYKYMVGEYKTVNELKPIKVKIKKLIPGAFNVAYYFGQRITMQHAYNLITE